MTGHDPIATFYERFPYPLRDPHQASSGYESILPASLPVVLHHVFAGVPPAGPFRALVAGGGTGDAVISLGLWMQRLALSGSVDYLDLSSRSCAIARARAEAAGVAGATFRVGAIEDLGEGPPGGYHYIDLCGVLNHVPDPAGTLSALARVLAPGGGLGLMAYGRLGRTGIYEAQAALRMLGVEGRGPADVATARAFLSALPRSNWLRLNPSLARLAEADDVELADLLLNPRDQAFSTAELDDLVAGAGLTVRTYCPPFLYDPLAALRDPGLRAAAEALDDRSRRALAELLQGSLRKHVLYAVKPGGRRGTQAAAGVVALLGDPAALLVPAGAGLPDLAAGTPGAGAVPMLRLRVEGRDVSVGFPLSEAERAVLRELGRPVRVGALAERRRLPLREVAATLESLQPRLTRLGLLHVIAAAGGA